MREKKLTRQLIVLSLISIIVASLLIWINFRFASENPGGNDFLVHWVGTRAILLEGRSPYSDETALQIQTLAYGRQAIEGEHELRVAYPLYSTVLFFPFALIQNFNFARSIWMTFNEGLLILSVVICLRLLGWKIGFISLLALIIFNLSWYHGIRPLINGNAVIVISFLIIALLLCIKHKADELAGVLLAFATIKPQLLVLPICFITIWALHQQRMKIIGWFFITLMFLSISSALLLPDWIFQNLREVLRFAEYNPPGTPASVLGGIFPSYGRRLGYGLSVISAVILIFEWWLARKADFNRFLWTSLFTLAVGQWVGFMTDPGNYIILLPGILMAFSIIDRKWKMKGRIINIFIAIFIFISTWIIFLLTIQQSYQPIQSPVLIFIMPGISIILLYWIRWWVKKPNQLYYENS